MSSAKSSITYLTQHEKKIRGKIYYLNSSNALLLKRTAQPVGMSVHFGTDVTSFVYLSFVVHLV
jgi:hypothetical protein